MLVLLFRAVLGAWWRALPGAWCCAALCWRLLGSCGAVPGACCGVVLGVVLFWVFRVLGVVLFRVLGIELLRVPGGSAGAWCRAFPRAW